MSVHDAEIGLPVGVPKVMVVDAFAFGVLFDERVYTPGVADATSMVEKTLVYDDGFAYWYCASSVEPGGCEVHWIWLQVIPVGIMIAGAVLDPVHAVVVAGDPMMSEIRGSKTVVPATLFPICIWYGALVDCAIWPVAVGAGFDANGMIKLTSTRRPLYIVEMVLATKFATPCIERMLLGVDVAPMPTFPPVDARYVVEVEVNWDVDAREKFCSPAQVFDVVVPKASDIAGVVPPDDTTG